jgi:hypothetical protein
MLLGCACCTIIVCGVAAGPPHTTSRLPQSTQGFASSAAHLGDPTSLTGASVLANARSGTATAFGPKRGRRRCEALMPSASILSRYSSATAGVAISAVKRRPERSEGPATLKRRFWTTLTLCPGAVRTRRTTQGVRITSATPTRVQSLEASWSSCNVSTWKEVGGISDAANGNHRSRQAARCPIRPD